jgi:outer membrane biosynthesis protein TonB
MINTLGRAAAFFVSLAMIAFVVATPAFSQAPTDAQRSAIRAACRSDYQAHCASISPGGMAALQCLQQNISSLSSNCQTAVRAVEAPAEPKAEPKAATKTETNSEPKTEPKTEPKAESVPAAAKPAETTAEPAPKAAGKPAKKPSSAQVASIRSACRSDYPKTCAGVPTGGAAALNCLETNKAKLSAACQRAVNAAGGGAATPATAGAPDSGPAAAPADAPAAALVLRPMRPREELFVLRSACGGDARTLCGGIQPGGGRIMQCLATQTASLSPACQDALAPFAVQ